MLSYGNPFPSQVVNGVSGLLWSYIWNLWLFLEDATGVSVPIGVATQYSGFHSNQALSRVDGEIGVFGITRFSVGFQCETGLLLRCDGIPFQTKQGNRPSSRDWE